MTQWAWDRLLAVIAAQHLYSSTDRDREPLLLDRAIEVVADSLGVCVEASAHHRFEPFGGSALAWGPSVRIAIHTWPERELLTLDIHAPAASLRPRKHAALEALRDELGWVTREITRLPALRPALPLPERQDHDVSERSLGRSREPAEQ